MGAWSSGLACGSHACRSNPWSGQGDLAHDPGHGLAVVLAKGPGNVVERRQEPPTQPVRGDGAAADRQSVQPHVVEEEP